MPIAQRYAELIKSKQGEDDVDYAIALSNLAQALKGANHSAEAELAFRKAIAIDEAKLGPNSADLAVDLKELAALLNTTGRYAEAEAPYRRALAIDEGNLGPNDPEVASDLNELAQVLKAMSKLAEAEPMMRRALAISEANSGPDHPDVATYLNNLAALLVDTNRLTEAETLMRRALAIDEAHSGPNDPITATRLGNLAQILIARNALAEAEPLIRRALAINEAQLGPMSTKVGNDLSNLAALLRTIGRTAEAEPLMRRALTIDEAAFGSDHPRIAIDLNNLAQMVQATGRLQDAEPLMRRSLAINEARLGPNHPNVARNLNNLGELLRALHRDAEAEPLLRRAVAIAETSFGPDHPSVAEYLNNLALYLKETGRAEEAEPVIRREIAIFEAALGPDHPHLAVGLNNLALLLAERGDWHGALDVIRRSADIRTADISRNRGGSPEITRRLAADAVAEYKFRVLSAYYARANEKDGLDESFMAAQRALASETAASMARASARFAAGSGSLAALVRSAQDASSRLTALDKKLLAAMASADKLAMEQARADEAKLTAELDTITARLATEFPGYTALANPEPLSVAAVQQLLKPDEALVQFINLSAVGKLPETGFVWAITKTDARWAQIPKGTIGLMAWVSVLRCGLDSSNWIDASSWPERDEGARQRKAEQMQRYEICTKLTGREANEDDPAPFDLTRAYELYASLFGGIEDLVRDKQLLIVPAGPLTRLPFQTLVTAKPSVAIPEDGAAYATAPWLGRRNALTVLPSVTSLQVLRNVAKISKAPEPFLGFGNPLVSGPNADDKEAWSKQTCSTPSAMKGTTSIAARALLQVSPSRGPLADTAQLRAQWPLPETADELCSVASTVGAQPSAVYLGEQATETLVKQLSASGALAKARVVHFATHGLLAGETQMVTGSIEEPALMLTPPSVATDQDDGLLTASEVTQLQLDADWVVLSACNTASADQTGGEDLSGLARAFFYAGARALLVSHWYVNSSATVELISRTFAALKSDPRIGRAEALRRAMSALIKEGGGKAHPAQWAPFVVVGEGWSPSAR